TRKEHHPSTRRNPHPHPPGRRRAPRHGAATSRATAFQHITIRAGPEARMPSIEARPNTRNERVEMRLLEVSPRPLVCAPSRKLLIAGTLEGLDHSDVVAVAVAANLGVAALDQVPRPAANEVRSEAAPALLWDDPDVCDNGGARVPGGDDHPGERSVHRIAEFPPFGLVLHASVVLEVRAGST